MSSAAGIGVSDAARRVLAEISLLDRQPPFRLSGRNQPSCPEPVIQEGTLNEDRVEFRLATLFWWRMSPGIRR
jgi:hypothetical protein